MKSTHSQQLERWLGSDAVSRVSRSMRGWYGGPIALAGVPGQVYATADGDFVGELRAGYELSARDRLDEIVRRFRRGLRRSLSQSQLNAGFATVSEVIEALTTAAQRYDFAYNKVGTTGVLASTNTLWFVGSMPAAGSAAGAAPGGTVPDDTSTGAWAFTNPTGGNTLHFISGYPTANVASNTLLLYDRIFSVTKTMNSAATEAVSGTPSRYQSNTDTDLDSARGNFLIIECRTALAATAHNWTVCTYTDQNGNTGATLPSVTGNSGNIVNRLDQPASTWFCPLATGDYGIKALTQMQCSATVATGAIDFTIGHPIAFMPCPVPNMVCIADGLRSALQYTRIFDDAALAFLELLKPATTATTYTGTFLAAAS